MNRGGETTKKHARMRTQIVHGRKNIARVHFSPSLSPLFHARALAVAISLALMNIFPMNIANRGIFGEMEKRSRFAR